MIKFLLPTLLIPLLSFANDCTSTHPLNGQPVFEMMNFNCLSAELGKDEVALEISNEKKTKKFCKKCNNPFYEIRAKSEDYQIQKKKDLTEALFAELEKELSFITIDLMKVRSSFSLPLDPKDAVNSCQFDRLATPKCQASHDQLIKNLKRKSQNAIATELASILSEDQIKGEGLLKRPLVNECSPKLKENHVFSAQLRYQESLLSKEILDKLKKLQLTDTTNIDQALENLIKEEKSIPENFIGNIRSILTHPLVKALVNEPQEFKNFLNSIPKDADNKKIVEMLNSSAPAKQFSKTISNRCLQAMTQASEILEKIHCSPETPYFADNAKVMNIMNKKNFSELSDEEAEVKLQNFCYEYNSNASKTSALNFNEIFKINKNNDPALVSLPKETFRIDAFDRSIGYDANAICKASKDHRHCYQNPESRECEMLKNYELLKNDNAHNILANTSDRNINEILRSLVGNGLPQNELGVDSYAVELLKKEGILPGASIFENNHPRDVATFQRETSHLRGSTDMKVPLKHISQENIFQNKPTSSDFAMKPTHYGDQSKVASIDQEKQTSNPEFSHLSDDEQNKILNYFKNKSEKSPAGAVGKSSAEKVPQAQQISKGTNKGEENAIKFAPQAPIENADLIFPRISTRENTSLSTPNKKSITESYNKALEEAQLKRSIASENRTHTPMLSLNKNSAGINEIEIEVNEEELSKVVIFKDKLSELLKSHSEEITKLKMGETFIILINNHEILLTYNHETKNYEAKSKDQSLPIDYLNTISHYFNVTLKEGPGKREALIKTFKVSQNFSSKDIEKTTIPSK